MYTGVSLLAQTVKNLPAMWETWIRSLGQKDLLEKEMATHSSILDWKIQWTEAPGGLQPAAAAAQSLQPCPALCGPVDCSLPGSSFHGILQARILE